MDVESGRGERVDDVRDGGVPELLAILLANLVPLVGVLLWNWGVGVVVVLYWLENGVIGAVNLAKMVLASRGDSTISAVLGAMGHEDSETADLAALVATVPLLGFFAVHYGIFWIVHGVFVFQLFVPSTATLFAAAPTIALGVLAMVVQHAVAAYREFYRAGHHRERTPKEQMFQPYRRVVVLHVTIVFGAILIQALQTPLAGLLLLIGLKTAYDVGIWEFGGFE